MRYQTWQRRIVLAGIGFLAAGIIGLNLVASSRWIQQPFPGFFLHENLTVGPYFLPQWSGSERGLRILDRVVRIDGSAIAHPEDLYNLVRSRPAGSEFVYEITRDGKSLDLLVPSMKFSFNDWFLCFGVYLTTGIAFLVMGVTPFYFRSSSPAALPLCFMVTAVFLWFGTTFDFMTAGMLPKEIRIFAFTLTPSAGIHLGLLLKYIAPALKRRRTYLILIYGLSLALGWAYSYTFFGPLSVWVSVHRLGYAYSCVGALVFLAIIWSALRGPLSNLHRLRLRVIAVGATLGFFLPTLSTVLTSSFQWEIPYNLALIPTVFFPLSVAYALLKYSLFDLGNTLKVGLSRITLTALLLLMYVAVVFILSLSVGIYDQDPLIPLLFSALVVLLFNPLLRWVEGVVDRYIDRQEYDPIQLQNEVSLFLRSLSRPQPLASGFLNLLSNGVGSEGSALFYRLRDRNECLVATLDEDQGELGGIAATANSVWTRRLNDGHRGRQPIYRQEAETDPAFRDEREEILRVFDRMKAELLIPIVFERQVQGYVGFGSKRSGRGYSGEDLKLMQNLTDQLALSLENGRLYEQSERSKEQFRVLYDESEAMNRKLVEVDRLKKQFVANISHELRTPISTILGYGEVLLDPGFSGDSRPILERLVNNGRDVSQLMDSLLDFSRMESAVSMTQVEQVNVKEVLDSLQIMTQRLIRGRPIRFRANVEAAIDYIESDAKKLQQILIQLLTNALKFTERGEIEVRIKTISENTEAFLEIAVSDTGIGIDQRDQEVIFEEFRQLDGSSTRHYGGTGLGLSLCRKLAQSLGGDIKVSSQIGTGSIFSLLLPLRPSQTQAVVG